MRVIAGTARSLPLKTAAGLDTRPTTDRIKETLFNIIQEEISGSRFLDLFSGSGAIGIEALSRGAEYAVFVEKNRAALSCIQENLQFTKLEGRARIIGSDCIYALHSLEREKKPFQVIFMDPPYNQGLERTILEYLSKSNLADKETIMITESSLETDFSYLEMFGMEITKQKRYKTNQHVFVKNCSYMVKPAKAGMSV